MSRISSFPPIETPEATVLILGTMPSVASLRAGQYYAHPRNAFWPIVARVVGFDVASAYSERLRRVNAARVAVWDVLASCTRPGSLDSRIVDLSAVPNDFNDFFAKHPAIVRVCFNGAKAEALFRRHVAASLSDARLDYVRLPSTSPANASIAFERKAELWCEGLALSCASSRSPGARRQWDPRGA